MRICLYHGNANKTEVEVPYETAPSLPEIIYRFKDGNYKFYRKGYAANSTMYYETEALHVPETPEEKV